MSIRAFIVLGAWCWLWCSSLTVNAADMHWTYAGEMGPEHWAELEGSACAGSLQSPINVIRTRSAPDTSLNFPLILDYSPTTQLHDVVNNGHSIQFDFASGDVVEFHGERFALKQLHFHEPSEHTLNGVRFPLEMHMVHFNETLNRFVVLAVFGYEGKPSIGYERLEGFLPLAEGETKPINEGFDLTSILPARLTPRLHYEGSLTTPPCTENVSWVLFEEPFMLSEKQVDMLKVNMPINNYRDVQPRNGRIISLVVH